jgi:hypothetical protein
MLDNFYIVEQTLRQIKQTCHRIITTSYLLAGTSLKDYPAFCAGDRACYIQSVPD